MLHIQCMYEQLENTHTHLCTDTLKSLQMCVRADVYPLFTFKLTHTPTYFSTSVISKRHLYITTNAYSVEIADSQ